jgi:hypothetical protein
VERQELILRQVFGDTGRVQTRAEQTFVGINVANAAQDPLIE